MSDHIHKSHNKTLLLYHLVFPAKYRRKVFSEAVSNTLRDVCVGIGERYEIGFAEIGLEEDHVHFLVQGIPTMPVSRIVTIIKSITAREIFRRHPEAKTTMHRMSSALFILQSQSPNSKIFRPLAYVRGNNQITKDPNYQVHGL